MEFKKITCQDVAEYICKTLAEDIDSPQCAEIKEHLEHCDNCSNYFKSVKDTIVLYRNYSVEVDNECHQRLMKYLDLEDVDEQNG